MNNAIYRGSCLCGGVKIALAAEPLAVALCHCRHCQKQTGSAFSAVMIVPAGAVEIAGVLSAFTDVSDSGQTIERRFCGTCGTPVQTASAATETRGVAILKAGLIDSSAVPAPQIQLYCDRALLWMPDIPGTTRFAGMPPAA